MVALISLNHRLQHEHTLFTLCGLAYRCRTKLLSLLHLLFPSHSFSAGLAHLGGTCGQRLTGCCSFVCMCMCVCLTISLLFLWFIWTADWNCVFSSSFLIRKYYKWLIKAEDQTLTRISTEMQRNVCVCALLCEVSCSSETTQQQTKKTQHKMCDYIFAHGFTHRISVLFMFSQKFSAFSFDFTRF